MLTYSVEDQHTSAVIGVDVRADALVDVPPKRNSFLVRQVSIMRKNLSQGNGCVGYNTSKRRESELREGIVFCLDAKSQDTQNPEAVTLFDHQIFDVCSVVPVQSSAHDRRADLGRSASFLSKTGTPARREVIL